MSWFRTSAKPIRRQGRKFTPLVECLENRIAPAGILLGLGGGGLGGGGLGGGGFGSTTDTYVNNAGGLWSESANWSLSAPPTSGQDAVVSIGQNGAINHNAGFDTVHTLTSDGSLTISGGTVFVTADINGIANASG